MLHAGSGWTCPCKSAIRQASSLLTVMAAEKLHLWLLLQRLPGPGQLAGAESQPALCAQQTGLSNKLLVQDAASSTLCIKA